MKGHFSSFELAKTGGSSSYHSTFTFEGFDRTA